MQAARWSPGRAGRDEQLRLGLVAGVHVQRAAGPERAARRQRHERRRLALDGHQRLPAADVQTGDRAQQPERVRHARAPRRSRRRCRSPPRLPAYMTITRSAVPGDDAQVVGDQHDPRAGHLLGGLEHLQHLGLHGDVQSGGRLVGDDQVRVVGDRHRDHGPLAHPAGELVRERLQPGPRRSGCRRGRAARRRAWPRPWRSSTVRRGPAAPRRSGRPRCRRGSARTAGPGTPWRSSGRGSVTAPCRTGRAAPGPRSRIEPLILRRRRQQPHHGQRRHRLARAGLADDAQHLARRHPVADPRAPRSTRPSSLGKDTSRSRDLQQGVTGTGWETGVGQHVGVDHRHEVATFFVFRADFDRRRPPREFGSSASRRPSPMKLTASTEMTSRPPANRNSHGRGDRRVAAGRG